MKNFKYIFLGLFLVLAPQFIKPSNINNKNDQYQLSSIPSYPNTPPSLITRFTSWLRLNQSRTIQPSAPPYCSRCFQQSNVPVAQIVPADDSFSSEDVSKLIEEAKKQTKHATEKEERKIQKAVALTGLVIGLSTGVATTLLISSVMRRKS